MTKQHRAFRRLCTVALIAAAPTLFAAPQGYYRWHDDAGVEHFSQQPPPGRQSEFIRTSTGKSSAADAPDSTSAAGADNNAQAKDTAAKPKGPMQAVPDKDPEKCKQAQDTQAALNSHARIREKVGDDYRYLTADEIGEQKKLTQESVDVYCEPAPK